MTSILLAWALSSYIKAQLLQRSGGTPPFGFPVRGSLKDVLASFHVVVCYVVLRAARDGASDILHAAVKMLGRRFHYPRFQVLVFSIIVAIDEAVYLLALALYGGPMQLLGQPAVPEDALAVCCICHEEADSATMLNFCSQGFGCGVLSETQCSRGPRAVHAGLGVQRTGPGGHVPRVSSVTPHGPRRRPPSAACRRGRCAVLAPSGRAVRGHGRRDGRGVDPVQHQGACREVTGT